MNKYLNKTEKEFDSLKDFEFEFELDLFYLLRMKRWVKKQKKRIKGMFAKKSEKDFLNL